MEQTTVHSIVLEYLIGDTSMEQNYRICNSCGNCKHAFIWNDFDSEIYYYCNKNKDVPAKVNSVLMDGFEDEPVPYRRKTDDELAIRRKASDLWDEWSATHQVAANGVCDDHEKRD